MTPSGSVPASGRRSSLDRPGPGNSHPSSLPRFEGFGSTLGGFARSPQVTRALPPLLRLDSGQDDLIPQNQQTDSGFVESLQTPFLATEAQQPADEQRHQSFRPSSLLAKSLGTFSEVFARQVGLQTELPSLSNSCSPLCALPEERG